MKYIFIFFFIVYISFHCFGQNGIFFVENITLSNAKNLAKQSKKNILIDTYADWCIPCKKMETEFKIKEVSKFFNANYLNVRINLDNEMIGSEYRHVFDIVFLPTIIILDPQGNIKYKIDKLIPGRELMNIAEKCLDPSVYFQSDASSISMNPLSGQSSEANSTLPERLVHVSGNVNPDYLYKEAYFRIELMDGSEKEVAKKYLATQTDWSLPQNIKFIFDFLYSTKSEEFDFFANNIQLFRTELGEQIVNETLEIFIENELNYGYPRPDYDRAKVLYSYINKATAEEKAYAFHSNNLLQLCWYNRYADFIESYFKQFPEKATASAYFNLAEQCLDQQSTSKSELANCLTNNAKATVLDKDVHSIYYEQAALLHILNKDTSSAKKAYKKAKSIAQKSNTNSLLLDVIQRILDK